MADQLIKVMTVNYPSRMRQIPTACGVVHSYLSGRTSEVTEFKAFATPWAACRITELVKEKGVKGLEGVMATLPDLANVNGLTLGEFTSAGMLGAVKATGFSAIAVDPTTQKATLSVVVSKTESLDEPEWTPVATNDVPVKADTSAGFVVVAPADVQSGRTPSLP